MPKEIIQNENQQEYFVIVVRRGNEEKFIENNFYSKHHINCSIKPNKAKKFQGEKYAVSFWENWCEFDKELDFVGIRKLLVNYQLV